MRTLHELEQSTGLFSHEIPKSQENLARGLARRGRGLVGVSIRRRGLNGQRIPHTKARVHLTELGRHYIERQSKPTTPIKPPISTAADIRQSTMEFAQAVLQGRTHYQLVNMARALLEMCAEGEG